MKLVVFLLQDDHSLAVDVEKSLLPGRVSCWQSTVVSSLRAGYSCCQ